MADPEKVQETTRDDGVRVRVLAPGVTGEDLAEVEQRPAPPKSFNGGLPPKKKSRRFVLPKRRKSAERRPASRSVVSRVRTVAAKGRPAPRRTRKRVGTARENERTNERTNVARRRAARPPRRSRPSSELMDQVRAAARELVLDVVRELLAE